MCNLHHEPGRHRRLLAVHEPLCRQPANHARASSDFPAPVIRNSGDAEEMEMMRQGMPPPRRSGGPPVTNITSSPHWRGWLKPENRCLVPFNSFA